VHEQLISKETHLPEGQLCLGSFWPKCGTLWGEEGNRLMCYRFILPLISEFQAYLALVRALKVWCQGFKPPTILRGGVEVLLELGIDFLI